MAEETPDLMADLKASLKRKPLTAAEAEQLERVEAAVAASRLAAGQQQQRVTGEALELMIGPVDSSEHGTVQAELRRIQVAVRGQMDGIRPIEAAVLTFRWTGGEGWIFEELETLVQGMAGELKPGVVIAAEDWPTITDPERAWAAELVRAVRPRG